MSGITIRVKVSPRAAILAGKTRVGPQAVEVTEEALSSMSPAQRLEIVHLYEGGVDLGAAPDDPDIIEPTIEAAMPAIDARAARREAVDKERRVAEARAAEQAAMSSQQAARLEATRTKALRDWVAEHGDDEQKARMAEGFLKPEEILDAVTDQLLDLPFAQHEPIRRDDACTCACAVCVEYDVHAPLYMDSRQFAQLTSIREALPEGASAEPLEHRGRCQACDCLPSVRIAARVSLPWRGWLLARDFALK